MVYFFFFSSAIGHAELIELNKIKQFEITESPKSPNAQSHYWRKYGE